MAFVGSFLKSKPLINYKYSFNMLLNISSEIYHKRNFWRFYVLSNFTQWWSLAVFSCPQFFPGHFHVVRTLIVLLGSWARLMPEVLLHKICIFFCVPDIISQIKSITFGTNIGLNMAPSINVGFHNVTTIFRGEIWPGFPHFIYCLSSLFLLHFIIIPRTYASTTRRGKESYGL